MHVALPLAIGLLEAGLTLGGVIALALAIFAGASVIRDQRLSGGAKVMWLAIIVLLPILGSAIYFGVRSDW